MCGGAIISGFIPPTRSRRVTGEHLWPNLKKPAFGNQLSKPVKSDIIDIDDDFETDFKHFKDDSDLEFDVEELLDTKPLAFSAAGNPPVPSARGNFLFLIHLTFWIGVLMLVLSLTACLKLIVCLCSDQWMMGFNAWRLFVLFLFSTFSWFMVDPLSVAFLILVDV